jgi:hypothetical protein
LLGNGNDRFAMAIAGEEYCAAGGAAMTVTMTHLDPVLSQVGQGSVDGDVAA